MRLAIFSDVHGNSVALEAILDDIEAQGGVDAYWGLGDLVALGPDPIGVLERLAGLPKAHFTRGNTEVYVCTGQRPPPTLEEAAQNSALLPTLVEVAGTFAWTQGMVTQAGWFDWVADLPLEQSIGLPDGTKVLGVHASPGQESGSGIHAELSQADLQFLVGDCEADLIFVGHTHRALDITLDGKRIVNLGSVSNPPPTDLRASYVLLEASESGHQINFRRVDYDRQLVIDALERLNHPGRDYLIKGMRGQLKPHPLRPAERASGDGNKQ